MLVEREAMQKRRKRRERKKHTLITKDSLAPDISDIASQLLPRLRNPPQDTRGNLGGAPQMSLH